MLTLRCTAKLLRRMGARAVETPPSPTTRLGDWYANLLHLGRVQLVLAVSEKTLLPVLVPARDASSLPTRLGQAVGETLLALGVPRSVVEAEVAEMAGVAIGRTANRQVLGSMTDFAFMLPSYLERPGDTLLSAGLHLAEAPCSPLGMESPDRMTLRVLSAAPVSEPS